MQTRRPKEQLKPVSTIQKAGKTRIVARYDVGFGNSLYIRGKGSNLSWDKGIPMKNTKSDEWVWETDQPSAAGEFKVLINDNRYEAGDNHPFKTDTIIEIKPRF